MQRSALPAEESTSQWQTKMIVPDGSPGFYTGPVIYFVFSSVLKLTLRQKIIYPVPLGFFKKQKYYSKQPREGQLNRRRESLKMIFEKVACYWRSDFFDISPQVALCSVPFLHCRSDTVCLLFRVRCFRAPVRPAPRVQLVKIHFSPLNGTFCSFFYPTPQ